jgi:hypothetical protein
LTAQAAWALAQAAHDLPLDQAAEAQEILNARRPPHTRADNVTERDFLRDSRQALIRAG